MVLFLIVLALFLQESTSQQACNTITDPNCRAYVNQTVAQVTTGSSTRQMFELVKRMGCSSTMAQFLCTAMYPSCDFPPKMPCRSFCEEQKKNCESAFSALGMPWPFKCDLFADSTDRRRCILPASAKDSAAPEPIPSRGSNATVAVEIPIMSAAVSSVRVKERGKLRIVCSLTGRGLRYRWFRDGQELKKSSRVKMKRNILKINKMQLSDAGHYHCEDTGANRGPKMFHVEVVPRNVAISGSASSPPAQAGGMAALSSNLTSLWKYVKGMEKQFEGGVHIYTEGGQKATKKGNTVNINLKVKDGSCDDDEEEEISAHCMMAPNDPMTSRFKANHQVRGEVKLKQKGRKAPVEIDIHLRGFDVSGPNPQHEHGFHVHTLGNIKGMCETTGPHWNPEGVDHGAPDAKTRHHGDLGNIHCDDNGVSSEKLYDHMMTLYGRNSVLGRTLIIHEGSDDMGLGGTAASRSGGNAGTKIACCIIGRDAVP